MKAPSKPENEVERIGALKQLYILDTPIQDSFERITRLAKSFFKVPIVAFSLIDDERQWFKSIQGLEVCETSRELSFCGHTINQDDIFIVNDTLKDERFIDNPLVTGEPHIRFYAGYPVRTPGQLKIGSLCLIDTEPKNFTQEDLKPLKDFVSLIESEIANSKISQNQLSLIRELDHARKSSLVDGVTRLWNRQAIETLLDKRLKSAVENHEDFGIALIDIDNFKLINDSYGHCAGDNVLRNLAKRLLSGYRDCDNVGRWGGEEFMIIVDVCKPKQLLQVAERARALVAAEPCIFEGQPINVTVTTGVSFIDTSKHPQDIIAVVKSADRALYQGKRGGKNIVVL